MDSMTHRDSKGFVYTCSGRVSLQRLGFNNRYLEGLSVMRASPGSSAVDVPLFYVREDEGYHRDGYYRQYALPDGETYGQTPSDAAFTAWLAACDDRWPGPVPRLHKAQEHPRFCVGQVHYICIGVRRIAASEVALVVREVPGWPGERTYFYDNNAVEVLYRPVAHDRWQRLQAAYQVRTYVVDPAHPRLLNEAQKMLFDFLDEAWTTYMHKANPYATPAGAAPPALGEAGEKADVTLVLAIDLLLDAALEGLKGADARAAQAQHLALYLERRAGALRAHAHALGADKPKTACPKVSP